MLFLLYFLSVLGYIFLWQLCFAKRDMPFGTSAFCAYVISSLIMFIGLLSGLLKYFAYIVIFGGFFALTVSVVIAILKSSLREKLLRSLLSPSAAFIFISVVLLTVFTSRQIPHIHDDFSHWMKAVKQMYYYDDLIIPFSTLGFDQYMPSVLPLLYACARVFGFSEGLIYCTYALCTIFPVAMMLDNIRKEKRAAYWMSSFIFVIIAFLSMAVLNTYSYSFTTLLVDMQLGIFMFAGLQLILSGKTAGQCGLIPLFLCAAQLTLFKLGIGLLFVLAITVYYLFISFYTRRGESKRVNIRDFIIAAAICALGFVLHFSWTVYYNYSNTIREYEQTLIIENYETAPDKPKAANLFKSSGTSLFGAFMRSETKDKITLLKRYVDVLKYQSFFSKIPVFVNLCVFAALFSFSVAVSPKKNRAPLLAMPAVLIAAGIVFLFGLTAMYYDIGFISEFYRYCGSVIIAFLLLTAHTAAEYLAAAPQNIPQRRAFFLAFCSFILFFAVTGDLTQISSIWYKPPDSIWLTQKYYDPVELTEFSENFSKDEHVLFTVAQKSTFYMYYVQYYMLPAKFMYFSPTDFDPRAYNTLLTRNHIERTVLFEYLKETDYPELAAFFGSLGQRTILSN